MRRCLDARVWLSCGASACPRKEGTEPRPLQQDHARDAERRLDGAQEAAGAVAVAEDEPVGVGAAEVDLGGEGRRVRGEHRQGVVRATHAEPAERNAVRRRLRAKAGRAAAALVGCDRVVWRGELAGEQGGHGDNLLAVADGIARSASLPTWAVRCMLCMSRPWRGCGRWVSSRWTCLKS